jgi:glycosyltransferase involved in cell wall biosynthesis
MRVCLYPRVSSGGPASFQTRLARALLGLGVEITYDPNDRPLGALLLFAGTRNLALLGRAKRDGIPIVQRLDGINWLQRHRPIRPLYFIRAEARNLLLRHIRRSIADAIIYQSQFVRRWWEDSMGRSGRPCFVVLNGLDLGEFPFRGEGNHDGSLLIVEGSVHLPQSVFQILENTHRALLAGGRISRTRIFGRMGPRELTKLSRLPKVELCGLRPPGEVRAAQLSAALHLPLEPMPPCPNSVIEALACGLPVVGFRTGSLEELVGPAAGELVAFQGDPWRLEVPSNLEELASAADRVLLNWKDCSQSARQTAKERFDIADTAKRYLAVMKGEAVPA